MVIWLGARAAGIGVEGGILRAGETQTVMAANDLCLHLEQQREQLMLNAQRQAQTLVKTALADAQAKVATARREADALLAQARTEAEASVQRGYEEGRRAAVLEWHARKARERDEKAQALRAIHGQLAEIVTTAVERIVHTQDGEALYQRALRSVRSLTRGAASLALRVSSADYEQARAALASAPARPNGMSVEVSVDNALQPGSCIFESELGILDASLEVQLEGLRAAMNRAVHTALADEDEDKDEDESIMPEAPQEPEAEHG